MVEDHQVAGTNNEPSDDDNWWWPIPLEPEGHISKYPDPKDWYADDGGDPSENLALYAWAARDLAEALCCLHIIAADPPGLDQLELLDYEEIGLFKLVNWNMRMLVEAPMISSDNAMSVYEKAVLNLYPPSGVRICQRRFTCVANAVKYFGLKLRVDDIVPYDEIGKLSEYTPLDPYSRRTLNSLHLWMRRTRDEDLEELKFAIQNEYCRMLELFPIEQSKAGELQQRKKPRRCRNRDAEFDRLSKEGYSAKDIMTTWNNANPNGQVSEDAVKKAISRYRTTQRI